MESKCYKLIDSASGECLLSPPFITVVHRPKAFTYPVRTDLSLEWVVAANFSQTLALTLFPEAEISMHKLHGPAIILKDDVSSEALTEVLAWCIDCVRYETIAPLERVRTKAHRHLGDIREVGVMYKLWKLVEMVDTKRRDMESNDDPSEFDDDVSSTIGTESDDSEAALPS